MNLRANFLQPRITLLTIALAMMPGCDTPIPTDPDAGSPSDTFSRVIFLDQKGLNEPATATNHLFAPSGYSSIGTETGDNVLVTSFVITIASRAGQDVKVGIKPTTGLTSELVELASTELSVANWNATGVASENPETRALLASGQGLFAVLSSDITSHTAEHAVGVLLPESILTDTVILSFFVDEIGGIAAGDVRIEIVREFYYVGVIGDSIAWGNGLRDRDKIYTQVVGAIESELGVRAVVQMRAQTGATIASFQDDRPCLDGCWGEVPRSRTSITDQAALLDRPELLDLVIVSACLNDVGLIRILDPFLESDFLTQRTVEACEDGLTELLMDLRQRAPHATIAVLGVYPIVSEMSDLLGVQQLRKIYDPTPVPLLDGLVGELTENAILFATTGNDAMRRAVATVNEASIDPVMAVFADPGLAAENAIFGPQSWLWNMTPDSSAIPFVDLGFELLPEDPIAATRWQACLEREAAVNPVSCLYGSVGHPNPDGAYQYARAVIAQLRITGILPDEE